jgi:hypothetical protein
LLGFTFTVSAPEALTGAQLQVDLFDKAANVCGQLFTTPQDLVARRPTTVSTQGIAFNWTCPVPVTIVSENASLYTAGAGAKTTHIGQSFFSTFTVQRPSASVAPISSGLTLVSAFPAAGATIVTGTGSNLNPPTAITGLNLTFGVLSDVTIPDAKVKVDLLDAAGTLCASSFSAGATALANMPTTATLTQVGWTGSCPLPVTTSTLTATLLNIVFPPGGSHGTRTDYIVQSFPIGFTFTPYPAPPAGAPQTAPVVSSLDWQNPVPGCGTPKCGLVFDDFPSAICDAYEVDGAPVTITIVWTWDTGATATGTVAFPAGASALSRTVNGRLIRGAEATVGKAVPLYPTGKSPRATAVCTVTNDRGQSATKTIQIPDGGL